MKENRSSAANAVRSPVRTRSRTKANKTETVTKKNVSSKAASKPKVNTQTKTQPTKPKITSQKKVEAKSISKTTIQSLDKNCLETIFQYVGPYDTLWNARRVCRQWNEIAKQVMISMKLHNPLEHFGNLLFPIKQLD